MRADDWPQWGGPMRDGVWRESGIVSKLPDKLEVKWRTSIGGGYAGPAVVGNRVFVADRVLSQGERNPDNPFQNPRITGSERILCLDAGTGTQLWKHVYECRYAIQYPFGPRATPTVHAGKVYTVGAMGDFFCLEAQTGDVLWSKHYVREFGTEINTWGMSSAPLIDGQNVILLVGGANNACVVALDKDTGKEIWRNLSASDPGYCPPIIIEAGGTRQLVIWNPVGLHALDPDTGKLYWRQSFPLKAGLSIPTPIFDPARHLLFVTSFYNGPLMMQLERSAPAAQLLWRGKSNSEIDTDGLHAIMCTPVFQDGFIYGVCSYGQLRCLDATTGKRIWETYQATGKGRWWNAFLVKHEDRYFICNEQGELIIAKLSPQGYEEISRAFLVAPTNPAQRRKVVWSHPAFANRCVYARNDKEIVCVDLAGDQVAKRE
jgi:outer membrane protein assembly factor BamB